MRGLNKSPQAKLLEGLPVEVKHKLLFALLQGRITMKDLAVGDLKKYVPAILSGCVPVAVKMGASVSFGMFANRDLTEDEYNSITKLSAALHGFPAVAVTVVADFGTPPLADRESDITP